MIQTYLCSTLAALFLAVSPVAAQVLGMPVVNNGSAPLVGVTAEYARTNPDGGDFNSYGAELGLGVGIVGIKGMASYTRLAGEGTWSYGGAAALRLVGGPFIPFRLALQGGYGEWTKGGTTSSRVPVSLGMAVTIPVPSFTIKPWVAPRLELTRIESEDLRDDDYHWGVSGGFDLVFLNGMTLRAAYDRSLVKGSKPGVLGIGVSIGL